MRNSKHVDMSGMRFGSLTLIKRDEDFISPTYEKFVQYVCRCDCGNEFSVVARYVKRKTGKSRACYVCVPRMRKSKKLLGS
jgi:hypothetical protein